MLLQEDKPFDAGFNKENCYYYNCNDNYILIDNMDEKNITSFIKDRFYCSSFYNAIYVVEGRQNLIVDGKRFKIEKNQYFLIMPCNNITILQSEARFFMVIVRAHIIQLLYDNIKVQEDFKRLTFTVKHYQLTDEQINNIYNVFKLMKIESLRPEYQMKDLVMRELISISMYESLANINPENEICYLKNSKQRELYIKFLEQLNKDYMYERSVRYYADKLKISPKYLSFITNCFTNKSASNVIDTFVVLKIKALFYDGELNVKQISELFNFQSQSFFGRYFKRITGLSPKDFVAKYNKRLYQVKG